MLNIKKVIKQKGLTVTSLAEKMEMKQVSLSRIINGNPTVDTLQKIASALEVPVSELFDQPQNDVINCPHCGGKIKISKHGLHG
jgi:transcriptional regulator with XRE-family HTH domain